MSKQPASLKLCINYFNRKFYKFEASSSLNESADDCNFKQSKDEEYFYGFIFNFHP